jgi:hypothetical protein
MGILFAVSSPQTDRCVRISISFDIAALSGFPKFVDVFQIWMTNNYGHCTECSESRFYRDYTQVPRAEHLEPNAR